MNNNVENYYINSIIKQVFKRLNIKLNEDIL